MSEQVIHDYDSDHTALVHVIWSAQRMGIMDKPDELAHHIMTSKWMQAVRLHAQERALVDLKS